MEIVIYAGDGYILSYQTSCNLERITEPRSFLLMFSLAGFPRQESLPKLSLPHSRVAEIEKLYDIHSGWLVCV